MEKYEANEFASNKAEKAKEEQITPPSATATTTDTTPKTDKAKVKDKPKPKTKLVRRCLFRHKKISQDSFLVGRLAKLFTYTLTNIKKIVQKFIQKFCFSSKSLKSTN